MRLQMNQAIDCLVDEAGTADRSHIDLSIPQVLHVDAFQAEW